MREVLRERERETTSPLLCYKLLLLARSVDPSLHSPRTLPYTCLTYGMCVYPTVIATRSAGPKRYPVVTALRIYTLYPAGIAFPYYCSSRITEKQKTTPARHSNTKCYKGTAFGWAR